MNTLAYQPRAGSHISTAISDSLSLAKRSRSRVRFQFNDITLEATPKKSPVTLFWEYNHISNSRSAAYWDSKRGQSAIEDRRTQVVVAQLNADLLAANLPTAISEGIGSILLWLRAASVAMDDIEVRCDTRALAEQLEAAGYSPLFGVGMAPEWFSTKERLGNYIIGQAIPFMKDGMPPHPALNRFIKDYFEMKA